MNRQDANGQAEVAKSRTDSNQFSGFIRNAVSAYLQAKERRDIDAASRRAYEAKADDLVDEVEDLMTAQARPES